MPETIENLIDDFASRLRNLVQTEVESQLRASVLGALGVGAPGRSKGFRAFGRPASAKVARARKLQGQYLGALKSLKGAVRARVKKTAKDKGVAAAVQLARSLKSKLAS